MLITSTNYVDSATITGHTTEQSSTYTPAENVQEMQLYKSYVADNSTSAYMDFDFGTQKIIDTVAVIGHNLDQSTGTIRVRIGDDSSFFVTKYDSGVVSAWPTVEEFGYLAWDEFHWGGILSGDAVVDYTISFYKVLAQAVQARYMRIDLANGVGNIEIGRVFAGPSYRPTNSMKFGWDITWVDDSSITKSIGGNTFVDERPRYRRITFTLPTIPQAEIFHNIFNSLDRRRGIAKDIIVIPRPSDETTFITHNIYGRMSQLYPVDNRGPAYYDRTIRVEEIV